MLDFVAFFGRSKFSNVTNGISPRRWLDQCNPTLSRLITETLGSRAWLKDLYLLKGLQKHDSDPEFHKKWATAKTANKERLAAYINSTLGVVVDPKAMFVIQVDILSFLRPRLTLPQVKRIHVGYYEYRLFIH